jgi:PAS domain S-box-containing protein
MHGRQAVLTKQWLIGYRRSRIIRLTAGLGALFLLVWRLEAVNQAPMRPAASAFIWGAVFLTTVLLVWRERNQAMAHRRADEENERFIAAAETSPDAFFILDAVRNATGDIVDFRFVYANGHAEELLNTPRAKLLHQDLCVLFPVLRTNGMFDQYRKVVLSGEPLSDEYSMSFAESREQWFRQRVNKLGDGVAIRTLDATEQKRSEERYRSLSNFSNSVFDNAPFSILEIDNAGVIQAMNAAAERLTGYKRADLIGKVSVTTLHDPNELSRRSEDTHRAEESGLSGLELLTGKAKLGEVDEREWTYVRNDGSTIPVHVAFTAVKDGSGTITGFIAIASDITERKQLMTYLNHMASHDQLTGLPCCASGSLRRLRRQCSMGAK